MKKSFTSLILLLVIVCGFGQAPQKMSYQCVIRNSSGGLVTNQSVGIRISVLQGSLSGTAVYQETYNPNPQTNANGLLSFEIGSGLPIIGNFSSINWASNTYFLKTEADPTGGTNYTIVGTSQLLSVPYALYAKTAGNGFSGNYADLTNKPILFSGNYIDLTNQPILFNGSWTSITGKPTTLIGFGITDGMSTSHVANSITLADIAKWNAGGGITDVVTLSGNQTITGIKTFSNDLLINGLTIGRGQGAVSSNTAIGFQVLFANTTGNNNTAIGGEALGSNTTGFGNTANGWHALFANTTGYTNTANGNRALCSNTTGSGNTANGMAALSSNTAGNNNAANGWGSLSLNTTGGANTANGNSALFNNTIGNYNVANGMNALGSNTTGNSNTAFGYQAGFANITGNYNVFLGSSAGYYETGSNKLFIDNQQRTNESDSRAKALIYGVFGADPANQVLTINGNVGIGTNTPSAKLEVAGQIKITGGTPAVGKVLTSDGTGLATWEPPASNSNHYVGESYGGGIIFWLSPNGQHGLIASLVDLDNGTGVVWSNVTATEIGADAQSSTNGVANTAAIIAQSGHLNSAAKLCDDYLIGVYSDWYLPSDRELQLLTSQDILIDNILDNDGDASTSGFTQENLGSPSFYYWSSTENKAIWGRAFNFSSGSNIHLEKNVVARVRAIRSF